MGNNRRLMTLGDLGPIITGKTPSTKVPGHFGGTIPFVTPRDMDGRRTIKRTERYLTEKGAKAVANAIIPPGSIMVSCIGSDMGKVAIAGRQCVTNQQINSIIVSAENIAEYVYYDLSRRKHELRLMASGSAQPILNKGHFSQVKIEMPEPVEQRAIAHILGSLDDKIELNRQMNRTLEKMAQAIFKSWFIDFDPVRAKAEGRDPGLPKEIADLFPDSFEDSEIGLVPEGWQVESLGNLLELAYGKGLRAQDRRPGTVAVYGSNGQVGWHDEKLVKGPGIVVGRKGNPGIVTWVPTDFFPIDTTFYVVPKGNYRSLYFLFHVLRAHDLQALAADSAVPGLNRNLAYMSQQVVPPPSVLVVFDRFVTPLYDRMRVGIRQNYRLAGLRDTLLPNLLSGELEVPDAVKALEDAV